MKKYNYILILFVITLSSCASDDSFDLGSNSVSQGGSLSKFTINGDRLYVVDDEGLSTFDISSFDNLKFLGKNLINRNIETIFQYQESLFLGTTTGMLIYNISDPDKPAYVSSYDHITGCDPVVANGKYAYVTLRTGGACGGGPNTLDIVDLSDLSTPFLVNSINLQSPYGLGLIGDNLIVCEKNNGYSLLDISDYQNIFLIGKNQGIAPVDVIIRADSLVLFSSSISIDQYRLTKSQELIPLSHFSYE